MGNLSKRLILRQIIITAAVYLAALSLSYAQSETSTQLVERKNIQSADRMALTLINTLPNSGLKEGLLRYYSILNPAAYSSDQEVAISNSGVAIYFSKKFNQNANFAESALKFYNEVRTTTRSRQNINGETDRHSRPSLADKAGYTRKDLPAGWLYKKALEYSKGDTNGALALIGLCGHDDKFQGVYRNKTAEENLLAQGYKREDLYYTDYDGMETLCPLKTSDFFIANSLSKYSDIDDNLKQRILYVQYPGKKHKQIAAKNYHVLGAAFMTCQMIEAGLNPLLAIQVESKAASLYRGIRLCQQIETPASVYQDLQRHPEVRRRPHNLTFEQAVLDLALEKGRQKACNAELAKKDGLCRLLQVSGAPFDIPNERIRNRAIIMINDYMQSVISAGIYSSWTLTGEIAGISIPCSRDQLWGPSPFLKWLVSRANLPLNICGAGVSVETCRNALKQIETWQVDFDWTIQQHELGASFAANVCNKKSEGKDSFNSFDQR